MNWREHRAGGALFGTVTATLLTTSQLVQEHPVTVVLPIFVSSFAAMIPDLDKHGTHASNLMPHLADRISKLGHRTIMHALIIPTVNLLLVTIITLVFSFINSLIAAIIMTIGYGFSMGWYSHLAYDIITPMGCPLLEPFIADRWSIYSFNNVRDANLILIVTILLEVLPLLTVIRFIAIKLLPML